MIIKFKNKMTMGLQKMIDEGKRLGGQPDHIQVSPNEAVEIFTEIRTLNPPGYTITSEEGASCKLLLNAKDLTKEELQRFALVHWKEKKWKVEYNKISVIVVEPTPQTVHLHG